MTLPDDDAALFERIAVFRHSLVARLLASEHTTAERLAERERILTADHQIPGSTRTRVADTTLRDWVRSYRRGGFEALKPKKRIDAGGTRALDPQIAERLVELREAEPALSIRATIARVRAEHGTDDHEPIAHSTVHRLFQRHGLGGRRARRDGDAVVADRRRFAFERPCQLWMSDVMHGPGVRAEDGRRRRSYLICLLDDATRVVTHAEFAASEGLRAFLPVLRRAILRRGLPERLYVDNGSAFRAHQLAVVCARLGIALIHARPYQPQGKGKIERFFGTVRAQLLPTLGAEDTASLGALNRRLAGWVEAEYHHAPHRGLDGDTPLDRWAAAAEAIRHPEADAELDEMFLFEAKRKVQSDRTVSLEGRLYEIDAALVGQKVTLRFDPGAPGAPITVVHEGRVIEHARQVDLYANCFVRRDRHSGAAAPDVERDTTHTATNASAAASPPPTAPPSGLTMRGFAHERDERDEHDEEPA